MALSTISGTTGITDATITSAKLADFTAAVDLNGVELLLDADQDTSITADTDDQIDFKIAGVEHISLTNSAGDTVIKPRVDGKDIIFQQYDGNKILEINDANYVAISGAAAGPGELRFYEDTDLGTHYTGLKAGNATASVSYVLPLADGTSGYQLTTDGSGTLTWAAAGATVANNSNNRILTATGSTSLNGEANLTFDGSALQVTGTLTVGVDDTGYDVKLFGATSGKSLLWDESADSLIVTGTTTLVGTTNLDAVDIDGAVQLDAALTIGANDQGYDIIIYGDTASANLTWDTSVDDLIFNGAARAVIPDGQLVLGSTAVTSTAAELNLLDNVSGLVQADLTKLAAIDATATELNFIDGDATIGTTAVVDADGLIHNDGGTMKVTSAATFKTYFQAGISQAYDDFTIGDAAVLITTSSGNITIDAAANDSDIILKGTDGGVDTTFLTIDGSAAGTAIFNNDVTVGDNLNLTTDSSVINFGANSEITLTHVHDAGLALKHTATADDKPIRLVLQTGEVDMAANDVIGAIDFQAPNENTGTDAILVSASIEAVSEGDFSSTANATSLVFKTGASEVAAAKLKLTSAGHLLPATDDTHDLGNASFQWRNIYTGDLHLSNMTKTQGNAVDGTKGDWTIQEGSDELYLMNNNSGKKYKFNLTEV